MRGKLLYMVGERLSRRITPAHAGKTCKGRREPRRTEDHPRACGENDDYEEFKAEYGGSPPRMRGKPAPVSGFSVSFGITPAHAGKTVAPDFMM